MGFMKVKFLGASGTVTGSSYVLTSNSGQSVLIDLGMFQGLPEIDKLNYQNYDFDCSKLSGAILTHAHLDHCGRLPILLSHGFKGDIWMTPATKDLTEIALLDSAKVAKQDGKPILYDADLAQKTFTHFKTVDYHLPTIIGDFQITMYDAGHILGSASLQINVDGQKIIFSGDLGNSPEDLLMPTEMLSAADVVVMESTYGDRLHPTEDSTAKLLAEINAVETSGGTLLIPAFSLERTQELLHLIMHFELDHKIKTDTPIYLDGPMAEKANTVYLHYPQLFNNHFQADLKAGDPFAFPGLVTIKDQEHSQAINLVTSTKVIIAGSGMMVGGRIVRHAAHFLPDPKNRLLIVGYQGEGTLGRQLKDGQKTVTIDGTEIKVAATVSSTEGMSSHADQSQLLSWLKEIKGVKKLFLTHGDDGPRQALSTKVAQELGITDIALPNLDQEISI